MATERPVALVTGASSGIGRGLAVRLARDGYSVGLAARRTERLREVVGTIEKHGAAASAHGCDVADPEQVRAAVSACRLALGPVDLLVANAGVGARARVEDLDGEDVRRLMQVNFMGAVYMVEEVLPEMLRRGSGHLVAVASLAGFNGLPERAAYSASKGAMINFFESLRMDLASEGHRGYRDQSGIRAHGNDRRRRLDSALPGGARSRRRSHGAGDQGPPAIAGLPLADRVARSRREVAATRPVRYAGPRHSPLRAAP